MNHQNPYARFLRQLDIVPREIFDSTVTIVGCGAIGRQAATMCAAMGPKKIMLFDFDTVEDHNRTTQGYRIKDVGMSKVDALVEYLSELYDDVEFVPINSKFPCEEVKDLGDIVMFCTDSIDARSEGWQFIKDKDFKFLVDGRMLAENMRVIAGNKEALLSGYEDTLFDAKDALEGKCTERMTLYSASVCAGNMMSKLNRFLRKENFAFDTMFSLKNEEYGPIATGFVEQ